MRRLCFEGSIVMVMEAAQELAQALKASEEYLAYRNARETALQNDSIRNFYKEYRRLQMQAEADAVAGRQSPQTLERLRHVGELLQFEPDAAEFLLAEYRLNQVLGKIYRLLAEAVEADLSVLDG